MRSPESISPDSADAPIEKICEKSNPFDETSTSTTGQSPTSAGQLAPTELNGKGASAYETRCQCRSDRWRPARLLPNRTRSPPQSDLRRERGQVNSAAEKRSGCHSGKERACFQHDSPADLGRLGRKDTAGAAK